MESNNKRSSWAVKPTAKPTEDIWAVKPTEDPTAPPTLKDLQHTVQQGHQFLATQAGKVKGRVAKYYDPNEDQRDNIEKVLHDKLSGNIEMEYEPIHNYLTSHPDVVNQINEAFKANLKAQGRPDDEIKKALNSLQDPWRVNYIYSLMTSQDPDYTTDYNVDPHEVELAILSGTQVRGGKRRRNNKNTKKYRKSRKSRRSRRSRKSRRTRK